MKAVKACVKSTIRKCSAMKDRVKLLLFALVVGMNQFLFPISAYADVESDLKRTDLYKGTVDLLKGISNVLLAITVLITIALSIVNGIKWQTADEQEKPMKKKALINTILIGVIVASIAGLIGVILNAYGLTDETGSGLTGAIMLSDPLKRLI